MDLEAFSYCDRTLRRSLIGSLVLVPAVSAPFEHLDGDVVFHAIVIDSGIAGGASTDPLKAHQSDKDVALRRSKATFLGSLPSSAISVIYAMDLCIGILFNLALPNYNHV